MADLSSDKQWEVNPETLAEFVSALQKACLPGVWSKGVAMSRDCPILEDSQTEEEIILRIQVPGKPVSPKVTLWPADEDWYCDCGDRNDPCLHIAAAALALKAGLVRRESPQADNRVRLEYRFLRKDGSLAFERWLLQPDGSSRILSESLVSWIGGIQSGRIHAPVVPATKEDFAIDAALGTRKSGIPDRETMERLPALLQGFPNVTLDGSPTATDSRQVRLVASIRDEDPGVRVKVALPEGVTETFANGAALMDGKLRALVPSGLPSAERERFAPPGALIAPKDFAQFVSETLPVLESKLQVDNQSRNLPVLLDLSPKVVLRIQELPGDTLSVLPVLTYGSPPIAEVHQNKLVPLGLRREAPRRDRQGEQNLLRKVISELQISPDQNTRFEKAAAIEFLSRAEAWEKEGAARTLSPQGTLQPSFFLSTDGTPELRFSSGSGAGASPEDVFKAWQAREGFVRLLDGSWARLPVDWLSRYGEQVLRLLEARNKDGSLPKWFLPDALQLSEELGTEPPPVLNSIRKALDTFSGIPEAKLPLDLKATLRSYQKSGVNWLAYLSANEMGALLADDMGLGKTLQALCIVNGKTLIVAPTSVLHSWAEQIARFRPGLRVNLYHGAARALDTAADVTLTSYAILRLDRDAIAVRMWDMAILDEAQVIRNPESQMARAAHAIQARTRIALTGTPVENRLQDLWSQFQFLNPGLLGTREEFQDRFGSGELSAGSARDLRARIRPFILRRLKKEVAPELPPRTESVMECELSPDERALYESVLAASRQEALKLLETGGSTLGVLETLLRLRQACCHPALIPGQTAKTSSKLELLLESLETSAAEGHRTLVFSQWTSFLDLIEPALQSKGFRFLRLDGSTPNRGEVVSQFQSENGPPILLISLKAGGVGLTLTAADHVFLTDPWWNPAVENQAADRAHRIGQDKPVMIYRLAARETVEERILELQQRKLRLAESVLEGKTSDPGALELTRDDLLALLS